MDNILQSDFNNYFVICQKENSKDLRTRTHIIYLSNREDIKSAIFILHDSVSLYYPDFKDNKEILNWLDGKNYKDVIEEISKAATSYKQILKIINKIGVPKWCVKNILDNKIKMSRELVHKEKNENVMVSKSERIPNTNIYYLQGYFKTNEIMLDHKAGDHVESVILTEICRQACIATAEETLSGQEFFIPIEDIKIYRHFVSQNSPLIVQVICEKTGHIDGYCVFSLYQEGKYCLKGCMLGKIFKNKDSFKEMRTKKI